MDSANSCDDEISFLSVDMTLYQLVSIEVECAGFSMYVVGICVTSFFWSPLCIAQVVPDISLPTHESIIGLQQLGQAVRGLHVGP